METKVCTKCKEIKTVDLFRKNHRLKNRLLSSCKLCLKEYQKKYRESDKSKACQEKYKESGKAKKYQVEYIKLDRVKALRKGYEENYRKSGKRKEYRQSDKGKAAIKKYKGSAKAKNSLKKYVESDKGKTAIKKGLENFMKSNKYFKKQLKQKGFKSEDITQDLIDQQRQIIETNRLITKINKYETSK